MFDSPLHWCPVSKEWVALDEELSACERRHVCLPQTCPLARLFRHSRDGTEAGRMWIPAITDIK